MITLNVHTVDHLEIVRGKASSSDSCWVDLNIFQKDGSKFYITLFATERGTFVPVIDKGESKAREET